MMAEHPCVTGCGQPTRDLLCPDCTTALRSDLRALIDGGRDATDQRIPGLLANLDETLTRQHVLTAAAIGVRSRSATTPLPYHETAAEVRFVAGNTLTTWARDIYERNPQLPFPRGDTAMVAAWLRRLPARLFALHPAADELYDEITHVVAQIRRVIDRARERIYLGPCTARDEHGQCGADLYGLPERAVVTCPDCGTDYDTSERRAWLLELVEDQLATAAEISRALPSLLDHPITGAMIRNYANRGRILARGIDATGRPRYRIGEVLDVATRVHAGACA